jgi:hypothetical protein
VETIKFGPLQLSSQMEIVWAQGPWSFLKSSWRLPTNTYIKENSHPHQFLIKTINVAHSNFKLEIWRGLKSNMVHIKVDFRELLWPTLIGQFGLVKVLS